MDDTAIVITDPGQIEGARWLAVRSALKLEIRGMKRRGRPARVLANEITGKNCRTRIEAYGELDDLIAVKIGVEFSRPLP